MGSKRQEAINKNCRDCVYDETCNGSWREQIEGCEITTCALYDFRPKTIATERLEMKYRATVKRENQNEGSKLH